MYGYSTDDFIGFAGLGISYPIVVPFATDDLDDSVLNPSIWKETAPDGIFSETTSLIITNPHINPGFSIFDNEVFSKFVPIDSTVTPVAYQLDIDWTNPTNNNSNIQMCLLFDFDNYAAIGIRNMTDGAKLKLLVKSGGSFVYNFETTIPKGQRYMVSYNNTGTEIKFWHGSATGDVWSQMGTTQVYSLAGFLVTTFTGSDSASFTGGDTVLLNNWRFFKEIPTNVQA